MRRANPAFIPRNYRVEEALSAAVEEGDYAPFETLLKILARPFDDQPEFAAFAEPTGAEDTQHKLFQKTSMNLGVSRAKSKGSRSSEIESANHS